MSDSKLYALFDLTCYKADVLYHNWLCERFYFNCSNCSDDSSFVRDQFYFEF